MLAAQGEIEALLLVTQQDPVFADFGSATLW
jgi:hypothetical protein